MQLTEIAKDTQASLSAFLNFKVFEDVSYHHWYAYLVDGSDDDELFETKRGKNGFGYDPIFIPKSKRLTFGEMKPEIKYRIDHRSDAFNKIKRFF